MRAKQDGTLVNKVYGLLCEGAGSSIELAQELNLPTPNVSAAACALERLRLIKRAGQQKVGRTNAVIWEVSDIYLERETVLKARVVQLTQRVRDLEIAVVQCMSDARERAAA